MLNIPGYHITEQLYESAHSLVYRARKEREDRPLVLKILKDDYPSPDEIARFTREYNITTDLKFDGVIEVYALERYKNTLIIVMEDFGGESLSRILENRAFTTPEFLSLAIRITDILGRIHQRHIMHKDINPSNIVWNPKSDVLKIIDFGISTELSREEAEIRNPDVLEGTLAYISPEQTGRMNRSVDYRTDLYSLGVTCYHLLTGHLPFQSADKMELVHCHLAKMPVPPCAIPLQGGTEVDSLSAPPTAKASFSTPKILSDIIMKLMAKNAEDRYQSAHGLKVDLEYCQVNLTGLQAPSTSSGQALSGFTPGQHDFSDRFQIPQKLYSREREISILLDAFQRVASSNQQSTIDPSTSSGQRNPQSTVELVLVTGYSGIGKTALVNEIHKPVTEKRGYFLTGKFDQFMRNIPYSALIQAFQNLVRQLLSEPEEQMARWKKLILDAVGPNAQILIEVIPEVESLTGPQPPVAELPPYQEQNRFNYVFQRFIRACASADHPLVVFLDDLQWADLPSLKLLEVFMQDSEARHILFIGAYRDNEVHETHPLMLTVKNVQTAERPCTTITLSPLHQSHVNALVAETVRQSPESTRTLAELCYRKTGGNPFFLNQLLVSLHAEHLLVFDRSEGRWTWKPEQIQETDITENVVELMIARLQKLSHNTRDVLKLAACLGNLFDLHTLSLIDEKPEPTTFEHLWEALQKGLILPLDDSYKYIGMENEWQPVDTRNSQPVTHNAHFKFLHDRVQQAAYSCIEEKDKAQLHLKIGRLVLSKSSKAEREEKLFEIVDHLNIGSTLISDASERTRLAKLNLKAGKKAKASAAYQEAYTYLQTGTTLLPSSCWQSQYELTASLHLETAETAYLIGNIEKMEQLVETVLEKAEILLDKVRAYEVKTQAYFIQNELEKTIQNAFPALQLLGISLPQKPTSLHIVWGWLRTTFLMFRKQIEELEELPEMTDPHKQAAVRILAKMSSASYIARPKLLPLIGFKGFVLSYKFGNTPPSTYIYTGHGLILSVLRGDIESQYRYGKLAMRLQKRLHSQEFEARTIGVFNFLSRHWKEHIRETFIPLLEAHQKGLESGDFEYAAANVWNYTRHLYFSGQELINRVEPEMTAYSAKVEHIQQEVFFRLMSLDRQIVLNLLDEKYAPQPWILKGASYNESTMLPVLRETHDRLGLFSFYCAKLQLYYLFGAYSEAVENARLAEPYQDGAIGMFIVVIFNFYGSLARLAMCPDSSKSEQKRLFRKVAANQKKMKKWAFHAPMNHLHKWYLVEAERTRVLGKDAKAIEYYDKAIAGARENEYLNEEALANEVAARFWLEKGKEEFAQFYMKRAYHAYQLWGAKRKVRDLEERYPKLLDRKKSTHAIRQDARHTLTESTSTDMLELDVTSVIKASQTLSGETDMDRLPTKIMQIAMENAGAERGMLLLPEGTTWIAKAETGPESLSSPARNKLPMGIINYVNRTRETVVLTDAQHEGLFTRDPYILNQLSRSVLAVPLIHQEHLTGILFLENTQLSGVFTPERLNMLDILVSQMAIALDNATLRTNLEREVADRTREAVEARKIAEEANQAKNEFLSKISHELRTPLNPILGYAQLLRNDRSLNGKQQEAVATIRRSGEHLIQLINELLDLSRIESQKLTLRPKNFPFVKFLKNSLKNADLLACKKGLRLEVELANDLPTEVHADEDRLHEILMNLIENAIKFTESGSVTLRVSRRQSTEGSQQKAVSSQQKAGSSRQLAEGGQQKAVSSRQKTEDSLLPTADCRLPTGPHSADCRLPTAYLLFEVEDTGIGIPPEEIDNIFLPFYQIAGDRNRTKAGTGLGLAISRELVRLMGGNVSVESVEGQGTRFWFDVEFPEAKTPLFHETGNHRRIIGYRGKIRHILVVDDNTANRAFLRDLLEPLGFTIIEAANGHEVLSMAKITPPDCIFMDVRMPGMDGIEATRRIRQLPELRRTIVIAISASVSESRRQESLEAGCNDFLPKPVQFDELLDCLEQHLCLEWDYEEMAVPPETADVTSATPSTIPPREILQELLQLAKDGYIDELQERLEQLNNSTPNFESFAVQLDEFAEDGDSRSIIAYLQEKLQAL